MKGMLIPTNGNPVEIDIEVDETGSTLHDLQRLVGGNIEPFDVIFGEGISLYVNEEGLFTCPPNRAVYATKGMEEAGYLSMMDYSSPVKEGELYSILCGDLVDGAALRVGGYERHRGASALKRERQLVGEGGLADTALLVEEQNREHIHQSFRVLIHESLNPRGRSCGIPSKGREPSRHRW